MIATEGRIPTLDGWRGIAISGVIFSHCAMLLGGGSRFNMIGPEAVGLFFAISGFLITSLLLREEEKWGRISLGSFYIRRLFRILPPAAAYLAFLSALAMAGFLYLKKGEIWATLLLANNYWGNKTWYTGHFWSLAIEEHFYLVWPLILAIGGRNRALKIGLAVIAAEIVWRPFGESFLRYLIPYQRTDMRLDAFAWACCAAIALRQGKLKWISSAWIFPATLSALVCVHLSPHGWLNFKCSADAILMAVLIVATAQRPDGIPGRILENAALRSIGGISYSLYLWQQLLISEAVPVPISGKLALLVLAAFVSYRLVETPFIGWGKLVINKLALHHGTSEARSTEQSEAVSLTRG